MASHVSVNSPLRVQSTDKRCSKRDKEVERPRLLSVSEEIKNYHYLSLYEHQPKEVA